MNLPFFNFVKMFLGFKVQPMPLWIKYKTLLESNGIDTVLRKSHLFGQLKVESNLKPVAESFNYSADSLISKFGRHRISVADARKYGRTSYQKANQPMLANILYGGEWGRRNLGNILPGDGWRYRGRGFIQITGRHNCTKLTEYTGTDYVNNPDWLLSEVDALISAIWFWNSRGLSRLADINDYSGITNRINGGLTDIEKRVKFTDEFKNIIK